MIRLFLLSITVYTADRQPSKRASRPPFSTHKTVNTQTEWKTNKLVFRNPVFVGNVFQWTLIPKRVVATFPASFSFFVFSAQIYYS